jgi:hypothetical protein
MTDRITDRQDDPGTGTGNHPEGHPKAASGLDPAGSVGLAHPKSVRINELRAAIRSLALVLNTASLTHRVFPKRAPGSPGA